MGVYNLQNPQYDLEYDLNDIFNRIGQVYEVEIVNNEIHIASKLSDTSNTFWASDDNSKEFNRHVPTFKSLHKDMYAFIIEI